MKSEAVKPVRGPKGIILELASLIPYSVGIRLLGLFLGNPLIQRTLLRKRRRHLCASLEAVGSTAAPASALTRNLLSNTALPWIVNALSRCSDTEFRRWVHVEGETLLDAAKARGKGLLVVNCHTGVSRLVPWMLMRRFGDVSAMEPEAWLARMGVRDGDKVNSISMRGDGEKFWLRQLFQASRAMADGKTMHVAMDGLQGTGGKARNFLGRTRLFHVGLAQVAISRSTPIIQVVTRIDERGMITVRYLDPLAGAAPDLDDEGRLAYFLDNYQAAIETVWREDTGNVAVRHLRHFMTSQPHAPERVAESA